MEDPSLPRSSLRQTALSLVWVGLLWNLVEAGVGLWSGIEASSVALIAFGLDSFVELFAGGVLVWHLRRGWAGEEKAASERKAHRLLGITFFVLAAYVAVQSSAALLGWLPTPRVSFIGIGLIAASALVMSALYVRKAAVARQLRSRALRAEAVETLVCDLQDLTVLLGLGLNALAGWWWADPLAALALIPFLLWEGWEGVRREGSRFPIWGDGSGPRLVEFLNDHLSGMVYDENMNVVEGVVHLEYLARDPSGETKTVTQEMKD